MNETKDTMFGLLRRTGPATAELFDPTTGKAYGFNFAAFAELQVAGMQNGKELTDDLFFPDRAVNEDTDG